MVFILSMFSLFPLFRGVCCELWFQFHLSLRKEKEREELVKRPSELGTVGPERPRSGCELCGEGEEERNVVSFRHGIASYCAVVASSTCFGVG